MKTSLRIIICNLLLAACMCICGCSRGGGAAEADGYSKPRTLRADEKALFESVTAGLEGVAYKPLNVAVRMADGTSYRFLCQGRETVRRGRKFDAVITVCVPLPGQGDPHVTSVERKKR